MSVTFWHDMECRKIINFENLKLINYLEVVLVAVATVAAVEAVGQRVS